MYVENIKDSPKEFLFRNIEEGMAKMKNGQIGVFSTVDSLRSFYKNHPVKAKPVTIPCEGGIRTYNFALTPNSPLSPYLSAAALEIMESGLQDTLDKKWYGEKLKPELISSLHTVVLSLGHMASIFLMPGAAIVVSLIIMGIEFFCCKTKKQQAITDSVTGDDITIDNIKEQRNQDVERARTSNNSGIESVLPEIQ